MTSLNDTGTNEPSFTFWSRTSLNYTGYCTPNKTYHQWIFFHSQIFRSVVLLLNFSSLFSSYFLISPLSWASDNVRLCHFLWWQSNNVKTLIKNDIICKCVRLCHFVYELSNNVTTLTMNDIICKCVDLKWHQELTSNDQMKQANPAWLWDFCKNEIEMGLRRAV